MIEVKSLTKYFGATRSIEQLSFSVEKGEVLGFLGPNGAGKSTTMRLLVGLTSPTAGTATIGGYDVQKDNLKVRELLGYLPEQGPLYKEMTVSEFLRFMAGVKGLSHRESKREMERTSSLLNLEKERGRLLRNLSKGTRQRASIAQALLGDPQVLILDEPTVGLDPSQINDIRKVIRGMQGEKTVILSTHILPEVELTCSRIVVISDGHIAAEGTAKELLEQQESELEIIACCPEEKLKNSIESLLPAFMVTVRPDVDNHSLASITPLPTEEKRTKLLRSLVENKVDILEFRVKRARLEDVFLRSTGRVKL
jgi:gliding motility-associated transport system ATP-binding protein